MMQVVQLLADELLRSKGGRPVAVRHLEDATGGPGVLAVQLQVGFECSFPGGFFSAIFVHVCLAMLVHAWEQPVSCS